MRLSLVASLFFSLGLIHPVWTSLLVHPEDLEGSGYDLDGSGSGSGDGSEQGETEIINNQHKNNNNNNSSSRAEGTKNTLNGFSGNTFGDTEAFALDDSEYVFVANSKSYLENKEVITVVIGGGVTGLALAAVVAGILIYKWQKKDEEDGYILGQEKVSDSDYQKPDREVVFV